MNTAQEDQTRPLPGEGLAPNAALTAQARDRLSGNWKFGVLVSFLYFLVGVLPSSIDSIGGLIGLILGGPLALGLAILFLAFVRSGEKRVDRLFEGFRRFTQAMLTYLLMVLYVILWALLLIVPGVIAAISYSMTFFILADNPGLTPSQALQRSKAMMEGKKARFFFLGCRFIPWALLCLPTAGIGFLWLFPYVYTTFTLFYEEIREKSGSSVEAGPDSRNSRNFG